MYLYVVESAGYHKIGITQDVKKRVHTIVTSCPFAVSLVAVYLSPNASAIESILHTRFAGKNVHHEWFSLDDKDLAAIRVLCAEHGAVEVPTAQFLPTSLNLTERLLIESVDYYRTRGIRPESTNQLPSFRELKWSSESWVRAVKSLKPYVVTKPGRGGGAFCQPPYPTLGELYNAKMP